MLSGFYTTVRIGRLPSRSQFDKRSCRSRNLYSGIYGYTPDDGAQHKTVVEVCIELLGKRFEQVTLHFERMRRKRNEMTYEVGFLTSQTESKKALADAVLLVQEILAVVKAKNPQLELHFKI